MPEGRCIAVNAMDHALLGDAQAKLDHAVGRTRAKVTDDHIDQNDGKTLYAFAHQVEHLESEYFRQLAPPKTATELGEMHRQWQAHKQRGRPAEKPWVEIVFTCASCKDWTLEQANEWCDKAFAEFKAVYPSAKILGACQHSAETSHHMHVFVETWGRDGKGKLRKGKTAMLREGLSNLEQKPIRNRLYPADYKRVGVLWQDRCERVLAIPYGFDPREPGREDGKRETELDEFERRNAHSREMEKVAAQRKEEALEAEAAAREAVAAVEKRREGLAAEMAEYRNKLIAEYDAEKRRMVGNYKQRRRKLIAAYKEREREMIAEFNRKADLVAAAHKEVEAERERVEAKDERIKAKALEVAKMRSDLLTEGNSADFVKLQLRNVEAEFRDYKKRTDPIVEAARKRREVEEAERNRRWDEENRKDAALKAENDRKKAREADKPRRLYPRFFQRGKQTLDKAPHDPTPDEVPLPTMAYAEDAHLVRQKHGLPSPPNPNRTPERPPVKRDPKSAREQMRALLRQMDEEDGNFSHQREKLAKGRRR